MIAASTATSLRAFMGALIREIVYCIVLGAAVNGSIS